MLLTSEELLEEIDTVLALPINNTFKMALELTNDENDDFEIEFSVIDKFELTQDFYDQTVDKAYLSFMCSVRDAILINDNQVGLKAKIKLTYTVHTTIEDDEEQEIEEHEYRAFIENLVDFTKFLNTKIILSEEEEREEVMSSMLPISLTLLNETCYLARRAYFSGQFTETTITALIQYVAVTLGLKKLHFVEPDNTTVYTNIYVHPEFGSFDILFSYLQERFGIYGQGLTYYVAEDVLFIYPAHDLATPRKYNLIVFKISEGLYAGMKNYHKIEEDTITVISNTSMLTRPMHNDKNENEGNALVYLKADMMIDHVVTQANCEFMVDDIVTSVINEDAIIVADKEGLKPKYNKPLLNNWKPLTEVMTGTFDMTKIGWQLARLYSIKPYTFVELHYDSDDVVQKTTGTVVGVKYTYLRQEASGNEAIGLFNAELSLLTKPHTATEDGHKAPKIKVTGKKKVFTTPKPAHS